MKKALLKDSLKEILKTYKRFISILLMAFLGVGFFAGVRATSPDMKLTIDNYFDKQNLYDIRIVSTLGLTDDDVKAINEVDGIENAIGIYSKDVFLSFEDEETVVKVYALENDINKVEIIDGMYPQNVDECVIEESMRISKKMSIGDYIEIKEELADNEDSAFKSTKLKVVGVIKSPLYISRDRGTTTLGSGKVSYYMYVNKNNINADVYTEIDVIAKDPKKLDTLNDEYKNLIANTKNNLENIKEDRQKARYDELVNEANEKLNEAQLEFDKEKSEAEKKIADAEKEIEDGKKEIRKSENKIESSEKELKEGREKANTEFANAENKINEAQNQLIISQTEINDGNALLSAKKNEAEIGKSQIEEGINSINATISELNQNKKLVQGALNIYTGIDDLKIKLQDLKEQLKNETNQENINSLTGMIANLEEQINILELQKQQLISAGLIDKATAEENLIKINQGLEECNSQKIALEIQLNDIDRELTEAENKLLSGQNQVSVRWEQLNVSKAQLAQSKVDAEKKFVDAEKEIANGKKKIQDAKKEITDGEKELQEKKVEFNTKIADAESKLIDAREKINEIENAKWYIFDRYDNSGFNSYSQDTDNVKKLGEVFPIVFFIIATLISLTSMSRMVEEERVQIGTLKALGYKKVQIMSKYIIYSLLASIIGGVLGAIFGLNFFPRVIISMYQMMYNLKSMTIVFNNYYALLGIGIMTICIVGATIYTANKELVSTPAEMMRPKSPKAGKRVLIEKIPFLWNRFNFTQKVTLRNMFRYKKRFLMTIVGIMGCTALIITGFGLKDSISKIMDYQYIDIYNYDILIGLKNSLTQEEIKNTVLELESKQEIEKCVGAYISSESAKNGDLEEDVQVIVTNNSEILNQVIRLKDIKTGEKIELNDEEIVITDKLSQLIDVKVGDEIILSDSDNNEYRVKIGGITEHYISHYVYMTENLYKSIFNKDISTNVLFAQYSDEVTEENETILSKEILLNSKVSSVTLTSYLMDIMNDTLSAMNFVVYVLIVSAGLLAFIVLYNLANINISERIRELATIKVLGFYDKEVYDYVTREIVLLTAIGILVGLVFGYFLNSFILGTCEIGILRFKRIILPPSYLYASIITIVFTCIVNFMTFFSLKKIDMIESLKSVE